MTQLALIRALVVAFLVGGVAVVTGYIYNSRQSDTAPEKPAVAAKDDKNQTTKAKDEPSVTVAAKQAPAETKADGEAKDTAAEEDVVPTFDVVGVEPTGETVVAGRSKPGAIVVLVANGEVVGRNKANADGEWTIILDKPLASGDYDVALRTEDAQGKTTSESKQRLAVSIPLGSKSKPLVVLTTPDGPASVLQQPEVELADGGTDATADQPAGDDGKGETDLAALSPAQEEAVADKAEAEAVGEEQAVEKAPDATIPADAPSAAADLATTATEEQEAAAPATQPEQEVAAVDAEAMATPDEAKADTSKPVIADLKVTVEAVESEDGKVYVAGYGAAKHVVQVYVADKLLGENTIAAGDSKWLVEGDMSLPTGKVEVRVDMIDPATGSVVARAAVDFQKASEEIVLTKVDAGGQPVNGGTDANADVKAPLPNVIIRKGDNLWNIARRLYGDGFRYTTIYQANKTQIRNPDLIYPGQVFLTPEGQLVREGDGKAE